MRKKIQFDFWYLIIFCAIYFSHESMIFGQNSIEIFNTIGKLMPLFLLVVVFLHKPRSTLPNSRAFFSVLLLIFSSFISGIVNNEELMNYLFLACLLLLCYLLICEIGLEGFAVRFVNIMCFFGVVSLLVWSLSMTVPSFVQSFPLLINNNGLKFYNFIFSLVDFSNKTFLVRNCGIFREQGVYVVYLVVALMFLFLEKKVNFIKFIILVITLITTFSTAGYIILAGIGLFLLLGNSGEKYKKIIAPALLLIFIGLYLFTDLLSSDSFIFSKFNSVNNSYGSWFARISSITGNLEIIKSNPLFGVGKIHVYDMILGTSGANDRFVAVDNTNTLLIGFASYGVLYGAITAIGFIKHCSNYRRNIITFFLSILILFAAFSNEDFSQNPLWYLIIIDGFSKLNLGKAKERSSFI